MSSSPLSSTPVPINRISFAANTTSDFKCQLPRAEILLLVGYIAVLIVGVAGNTLVLIIFQFKWKKGPIIDLLIFYLALFDALGSFFGPLIFIYWILTCHRRWDFGLLGCKIFPLFARVITNISIGIILIMAIDRCRSIVFPLKRRFRRTTIHIAVFATLVISILWEIYYTNGLFVNSSGACSVVPVDTKSFAYPLITLVTARALIFITVFSTTTIAVYIKLHNCDRMALLRSSSSKTPSKNKNVMKMLVTMATVFILSVVPRDILHLSFTISWLNKNGIQNVAHLNQWLRLLQISNGIYNVFIYGKMYDNFWKSLKMMLHCRYSSLGAFESQISHFDLRKSFYSEETRRVTITQNWNETEYTGVKFTSIKSKISQISA